MADFDAIWQQYMASGHPYVESQDRGQDLEPFEPDSAEDAAWVRAFQREHGGRPPAYEDYYDRLWSQQFAGGTGKTPDLNDWRIHYYVKYKGDDPERAADRVSYETGKPVNPVRPTYFYQDRFGPESAPMRGARSPGGGGGAGGSAAASASDAAAKAGLGNLPPLIPGAVPPRPAAYGPGGSQLGAEYTPIGARHPYTGSAYPTAGAESVRYAMPESMWSPWQGVTGLGPGAPAGVPGPRTVYDTGWGGPTPRFPSPWDEVGNLTEGAAKAYWNNPFFSPGPWWRWLTGR